VGHFDNSAHEEARAKVILEKSHSEGITHQFKNQKPMPSLFYHIFEPNGQNPFADRKPQSTRAKAGGKHWDGSYNLHFV
jgi:hypothetical protein